MPSVKVVILNWNGEEHLREFLPFVIASTPAQYEIIVVDNGSTDNSVQVLRQEFREVTLIEFSENYGYAGGYNKALELLDADYFLLLNSDVKPSEGYVDALIEAMINNEKLACVAPKLLSYRHPTMFEYAGASGGYIDSFGYTFCRGRILNTVEQDKGQYDDFQKVFWASGACLLVRSVVFKSLGGFDADFFAHMEEIDFCWRAQKEGYQVAVCPKSVVYHLGGGSLSSDSPFKLQLNYRNNLAMMYKNLPSLQRPFIIFSRMCLDGMSALVYLIQGKKSYFKAVVTAHKQFRKMKPNLREKRVLGKNKPQGVYKGSIVLRYFLGRKYF